MAASKELRTDRGREAVHFIPSHARLHSHRWRVGAGFRDLTGPPNIVQNPGETFLNSDFLLVFPVAHWLWRAWKKRKEGNPQTLHRRDCFTCFTPLASLNAPHWTAVPILQELKQGSLSIHNSHRETELVTLN